MRRLVLGLLLFSLPIVSVLPRPTSGQYNLDVKTRFEDMARLQSVRQGIKAALEEDSWASVVEVGEDYSLWFGNLNRTHQGDSIQVSLSVALRTPTLLGRGNHVDVDRGRATYHREQMRTLARNLPSARLDCRIESPKARDCVRPHRRTPNGVCPAGRRKRTRGPGECRLPSSQSH